MWNKRIVGVSVLAFAAASCYSQPDVLSLRDCIQIGIENNLSLKNTAGEMQKGKYELSGNRFKLLPVIQAFGNFTDNVDQGSTVGKTSQWGTEPTPDAVWMQSTPMRYNTNGGLQLSLPLYDQTLYTGIQISKRMNEINRLNYSLAREELVMEISRLYYLAQTNLSQIRLADENICRLVRLQDITQALLDNGMIMEVDLSRVKYQLEDARVRKDEVETLHEHQLNLLRYCLDLSPDYVFTVCTLDSTLSMNSMEWHSDGNTFSMELPELKLTESRIALAEEQGKSIRHRYIPSLSLVGGLSYTKYEAHFSDYFHSGTPREWYNNFYWGISLKIPLFDGFQKRTEIRKNRIDLQNRKNDRDDMLLKLETDYANGMNTLNNSLRTFRKQSDNYKLARNIYDVTVDKYKEGLSSMTDLLQDEINISNAQNNCINAFYNYKLAELTLLRLSGRLNELTK